MAESEDIFPALPLTSFVTLVGSPQQLHFLLNLLQSLKSLKARFDSNWGLSLLQCNVIVICCNASNKQMVYFLATITLFILYHLLFLFSFFFSPIELWQDLKEPNHFPELYIPGKLSMLKGVYHLQVKGSQLSETHP